MDNSIEPGKKTCPYCAEVIQAAAIKCRFCGSDLTPAPNDEISYWGHKYSLGKTLDPPAYHIWEREAGTGTPVESRPLTEDGWNEIWKLFSAQERVQWTSKSDVLTCPNCHCVNVSRITGGDKVVSALAVGVFSLGRLSKSYECLNCKYRW